MKQRARGSFLVVLAVGLLALNGCAATKSGAVPAAVPGYVPCPQAGRIDLKKYNLDLVVIEPDTVLNPKFFQFMSAQRATRLAHLHDAVSEGFRSASVTMLQVKQGEKGESSCLGEVFTDVDGFAKQEVRQHNRIFSEKMLLAAGLVPSRVKPEWSNPAVAAAAAVRDSEAGTRTLRVVVMFAEEYKVEADVDKDDWNAAEYFSKLFRGEGKDTCESIYPSQKTVSELFAKHNAFLLLVTPSRETRLRWQEVFAHQDALFFHAAKVVTDAASYQYSAAKDPTAEFLRRQVLTLACESFADAELACSYMAKPPPKDAKKPSLRAPIITYLPIETVTSRQEQPAEEDVTDVAVPDAM